MKLLKMQSKKYQTIIIILLIAFLSLIIVDKLTKRSPLSFDEAILLVEENNKIVDVEFKKGVANFENVLYDYDDKAYSILAWQTPIHKILNNKSTKKLTLDTNNIDYIYYTGIKDENNLIIYGNNNEASVTLPRLALNYYLILTTGVLIFFALLSFIFKNVKTISELASIVCLVSIAYIVSHVLVMMPKSATYFIERDFTFIISLTLILSSILISIFKRLKVTRQLTM